MKKFLAAIIVVSVALLSSASLVKTAGPSDPVAGSSVETNSTKGPTDPLPGS